MITPEQFAECVEKTKGTQVPVMALVEYWGAKDLVCKELIKEAQLRHEWAAARFEEWDNSEDMHDEEAWRMVVRWLNGELGPVPPREEWLK